MIQFSDHVYKFAGLVLSSTYCIISARNLQEINEHCDRSEDQDEQDDVDFFHSLMLGVIRLASGCKVSPKYGWKLFNLYDLCQDKKGWLKSVNKRSFHSRLCPY